ncbi:hypothetical protein NE237_003372 [Protea cynaroides]|uniref:Uncharacterized protein n=1 Tax=Protea cynaroides TaxID=273540 RepID=A0A9Q0QSI9_9MAGN|nr:hypothetical protein NE237_003372 [Protea cynaroides]
MKRSQRCIGVANTNVTNFLTNAIDAKAAMKKAQTDLLYHESLADKMLQQGLHKALAKFKISEEGHQYALELMEKCKKAEEVKMFGLEWSKIAIQEVMGWMYSFVLSKFPNFDFSDCAYVVAAFPELGKSSQSVVASSSYPKPTLTMPIENLSRQKGAAGCAQSSGRVQNLWRRPPVCSYVSGKILEVRGGKLFSLEWSKIAIQEVMRWMYSIVLSKVSDFDFSNKAYVVEAFPSWEKVLKAKWHLLLL